MDEKVFYLVMITCYGRKRDSEVTSERGGKKYGSLGLRSCDWGKRK